MHDTTELPELSDSTLGRSADRSRWMALVVLCTGMLMIVLNGKSVIVNVDSPQLRARQSRVWPSETRRCHEPPSSSRRNR